MTKELHNGQRPSEEQVMMVPIPFSKPPMVATSLLAKQTVSGQEVGIFI